MTIHMLVIHAYMPNTLSANWSEYLSIITLAFHYRTRFSTRYWIPITCSQYAVTYRDNKHTRSKQIMTHFNVQFINITSCQLPSLIKTFQPILEPCASQSSLSTQDSFASPQASPTVPHSCGHCPCAPIAHRDA